MATKPAQGLNIPNRALDAGLPANRVTADEAHGKDSKFRLGLQRRHIAYVLAVPATDEELIRVAGTRWGPGRPGPV